MSSVSAPQRHAQCPELLRSYQQACCPRFFLSGSIDKAKMLIGYMRVSNSDRSQVLDLQRDALRAAGVAPDRVYQGLASGRKDDRPGLVACLKALQPGNTLVVWKLDRLGCDLKHLVNTIDDLSRRDIGLKVLAGVGAQIDTTTAKLLAPRSAASSPDTRWRAAAPARGCARVGQVICLLPSILERLP